MPVNACSGHWRHLVVKEAALQARWVGAAAEAEEGGCSPAAFSGHVLWRWSGCSSASDTLEHLIFVYIQKQLPKLARTQS